MSKTIEEAFNSRMQVLGFENNQINLIWDVMSKPENKVTAETYNEVIEFLKVKLA